jgi:hypothetical protein
VEGEDEEAFSLFDSDEELLRRDAPTVPAAADDDDMDENELDATGVGLMVGFG